MTPPRIGFMQGRLVAPVGGKIQAFPWEDWRQELTLAEAAGFGLMEWTLDHGRLDENPFMTPAGQAEIRALSKRHRLRIETLTGDCFMQAPFWKAEGGARAERLRAGRRVLEAAAALEVALVVVPLVDGGSLASAEEESALRSGLAELEPALAAGQIAIAFESDFPP
ncbi:MAG: hypothetical protein ACREDZ_05435, partial [Kiloniellales bacterium]